MRGKVWTFPSTSRVMTPERMTEVATRMRRVSPLGSQMLIFWRLGLKVRRLTPVVLMPTPPRYLALPRRVMWLPKVVFFPLTSH